MEVAGSFEMVYEIFCLHMMRVSRMKSLLCNYDVVVVLYTMVVKRERWKG